MGDTDWTIPGGAGRAILQNGAVLECALLGTNRFVRYCDQRGLRISRERLVRLERLRMFAPVFRVRTVSEAQQPLRIPLVGDGDIWFERGWAVDTTPVPATYEVPDHADESHEAYYSIFQIDHLEAVLSAVTLHVHLDSYVDGDDETPVDWAGAGARWMELAQVRVESFRHHGYNRAVSLLCQHISNRYYPYARSNMRAVRHGATSSSDRWVVVDGHGWDWRSASREWNAEEAASFYELTPEKLRHAYEGLAIAQAHCDPIERWYELTQFISVPERDQLKGRALRAETLRGAAHMLRRFYKDLYGGELRHPNEVGGTVLRRAPELEVRRDVRRHLEFVANRFGVNPQPRLSLIVEGRSEKVAVTRIFERWVGAHPGIYGVEVISLGGVDHATGGKDGRFKMIMRLIDYMHHHQTFAILVLDNERDARKLKAEAERMKSIHDTRYVTRPEYVNICDVTFEFDNFSDAEIAAALNEQADIGAAFSEEDVSTARADELPGATLKRLFRKRNGSKLDKVRLSEVLTDSLLASSQPETVMERPIVQIVERAAELAATNHLPTTEEAEHKNQESSYFGDKL